MKKITTPCHPQGQLAKRMPPSQRKVFNRKQKKLGKGIRTTDNMRPVTTDDCITWFLLGGGAALSLWILGMGFSAVRRVTNLSVGSD